MRILITGGAGYLGRGLRIPFEREGYQLRLMDVVPAEGPHENLVGDVTKLEDCRKAVEGMDAMIVAHMAPRNPDAYLTPVVSFDINVKGTANLFFAAAEQKMPRAVLISSGAATSGHGEKGDGSVNLHSRTPKSRGGMYGLTKALQEVIAEQYSREFGMAVSVLRPSYVMDQDSMRDKYGKQVKEFSHHLSDRRDIGEVARLCLERSDIKFEAFNVMSTDESMTLSDVQHTCDFLNWKPQYPFRSLPKPKGLYGT